MICVGLDWAESHHDIVVLAETGELLAELRVGDTLAGVEQLHAVVAPHVAAPAEVVVGTESVHGLVVQALVAAGYTVYEINPKASSRYRDRQHLSGASPITVTPRCWPTWCAPIGTTTVRTPATRSWPRPSRCWRERTNP